MQSISSYLEIGFKGNHVDKKVIQKVYCEPETYKHLKNVRKRFLCILEKRIYPFTTLSFDLFLTISAINCIKSISGC